MLTSLSIKNFRSILDLTLPLTYGEDKAPNGYKDWPTLPFLEKASTRAVPVLGLFGANASGKSTIVQGLTMLRLLLGGHHSMLFQPNRLHHSQTATGITIGGVLPSGRKFTYAIAYDEAGIHSETLLGNGQPVFSQNGGKASFAGVQNKYYDQERLKEFFRVECLDVTGHQVVPILSRIAGNYVGLDATISAVYKTLIGNCKVFENNNFSNHDGLQALTEALGTLDNGDKSQAAFAEIGSLLRKLDLGIQRMEYRPLTALPDFPVTDAIHTYHKDEDGKEVRFRFQDESMGTRAAFGLLGVCLAALHTGQVLVIDEIDSSLHSLLVAEIIRLFKDKRYNTKQSQLIFTAHNTDLLDRELLRVSEVGIVNKTLQKGTTVKRLSDFEGLRNVSNFRKQYLEGRFSGIPFPYL